MPIVAEAARRSGRPPILVGLPVLAGLSMVHGMLPPHPAAMLAAAQYHADLGRTILWGLTAGLPAAALAGPGLGLLPIRPCGPHHFVGSDRGVPRGGAGRAGAGMVADPPLGEGWGKGRGEARR